MEAPLPQERYKFVKNLREVKDGKIILVREPPSFCHAKGRLLVQKRLRYKRFENRAEDPFREIEVYKSLQNMPHLDKFMIGKNNYNYEGHPNILKMVNHYELIGDIIVITLEYADGGDYLDHSAINSTQYGDMRIHFTQICQGLKYLHQNGYCHLDISPENVLMKTDNIGVKRALLMDFGMALPINEPVLGFRGKTKYAAPELWLAGPSDGTKADVWSLGIFLFAILTRGFPFQSATNCCKSFHSFKKYEESNSENGLKILINRLKITKCFTRTAFDLLKRMLLTDPDRRISLDEILDHSFCSKSDR